MAASSSREDWEEWKGGRSLPPKAHLANVRMDRIGQKGVLAAVPHARDKLKASEGEVPFDIGGTVKRRYHHLKYTTRLLGHTRVLEVGDFHGAVTGTTRLASEPDTAGSAVLLHVLVRIGAQPSHSRGSSHQGLGVSLYKRKLVQRALADISSDSSGHP